MTKIRQILTIVVTMIRFRIAEFLYKEKKGHVRGKQYKRINSVKEIKSVVR